MNTWHAADSGRRLRACLSWPSLLLRVRLTRHGSGRRAPVVRCGSRLRLTKTGDLDESGPRPVEHEMVELSSLPL